ncbi:MAG: family intrarane metalloprotease [Caulobacter sp.]|nr:family intrarane metalloprotease [Caulobacter sp.]
MVTTGVELGNARVLAPGRLRWLRALGWMALLAVLGVATFNVAADTTLRVAAMARGAHFTTRAAAPGDARLAAVIVGSIAMLLVYGLAVRLGEKRAVRELALAWFVPEILGGLAIGGVIMAAIIGALAAAGMVTIEAAPVAHISQSLKETIQSSVIEETLLRLVIFRLLWRAFGVWPALGLAALLFGALHLGNPGATVFSALCLLAGEGIGAGLYMLTGRPWLSIGMHAGWNFTQGWVFGSAVSGVGFFAGGPLITRPVAGVAPFLSGGGFGPESSLSALILSLVASVAILWLAWVRGGFRERAASV